MSPGATPPHIAPLFDAGAPPSPFGAVVSPLNAAPPPGAGVPDQATCWICPPFGLGAPSRQLSPADCANYRANPASLPTGWTLSPTAACQGSSLPPSPAGGGATPVTRGYSQLPPAIPSTSPNVTINGQPMICCPCTT